MPRFVILSHEFSTDRAHENHFDFMLEVEDGLRTWRIGEIPSDGGTLAAIALPLHRKHYLNYEGPVSGNRGSVKRLAEGEYSLVSGQEISATDSLSSDTPISDSLSVRLSSNELSGIATLTPSDQDRWIMQFNRD